LLKKIGTLVCDIIPRTYPVNIYVPEYDLRCFCPPPPPLPTQKRLRKLRLRRAGALCHPVLTPSCTPRSASSFKRLRPVRVLIQAAAWGTTWTCPARKSSGEGSAAGCRRGGMTGARQREDGDRRGEGGGPEQAPPPGARGGRGEEEALIYPPRL
jgi:hypothetical protein